MNSKDNQDREAQKQRGTDTPEESHPEAMKDVKEREGSIVARLKNFPKSRRKSVLERSRKIAARRLTPNASQELHRFETHNPQRDFNEVRYHENALWRHEVMRPAKDDDSVSDYLIIPDRDRIF